MYKKRKKRFVYKEETEEDEEISVQLKRVSKVFALERRKFKHLIFFPFKKEKRHYFQALEAISFDVKKGECIGFIGLNGSGKSTLSSLVAGHLEPTNGTIKRNGSVSLLAISSGLKANLTGHENIQLKLLLMGFKPSEINKRIQKIVEFTELHEFINQPLKYYSSGMRAKLGFGIAIQTDPDILIIDEALSVGDPTFYEKCLNEIARFKEEGKTIFFISHAISQIREMCDQVAWIHYGKLELFGESQHVCLEYSKYIHHFNKKAKKERNRYQKKMIAEQKIVIGKKQEFQKHISGAQLIFIFFLILLIMTNIFFMMV